MRERVNVDAPAGITSFRPATTCLALDSRHACSHRMPSVSKPSTVADVSSSLTPITAQAFCPITSKPRA